MFTHTARRSSTTLRAMRRASRSEAHVTSTTRSARPFLISPFPLYAAAIWLFAHTPSRHFHGRIEYAPVGSSPIHFGTSGWRGLIAEDFTYANVRIAVQAIAEHAKKHRARPTLLVAYDTRF